MGSSRAYCETSPSREKLGLYNPIRQLVGFFFAWL